MFINRSLL